MAPRKRRHILQDLVAIALSVVVAIVIVRSEIVHTILGSTAEFGILGSFVAGAFFTSVITTAPAIAVLGEIAQEQPILFVAAFGASGALLGDLLIFLFIRDRLSEDLGYLLKQKRIRRYLAIFKLHFFRWLTPLVGALIIASPLPDELGLAMMGLSRLRLAVLVPISLLMNFIGIVLIGYIANL